MNVVIYFLCRNRKLNMKILKIRHSRSVTAYQIVALMQKIVNKIPWKPNYIENVTSV